MTLKLLSMACITSFLIGCSYQDDAPHTETAAPESVTAPVFEIAADHGTCSGTYPSYWQDPKFPEMYQGQTVSDQALAGYDGPVFRLSDAYPTTFSDEAEDQPWRMAEFDALFDSTTDQQKKAELADGYMQAVLTYIQAGNIDSGDTETDWDVCDNKVRSWYHIPFQTYNVLAGREFTHGLTREAPVSFSMNTSETALNGTMWAIAFFNPTAAYTIGSVWKKDGKAHLPAENVSFNEGAVVGKPLFTTLSSSEMPMLTNLPTWKANISDPNFCSCKKGDDESQCTMAEESQQCPRSLNHAPVTLLQFDIAVKDSRAPGTQWVFGTFVADGQRKAHEPNPWKRISPLGLMWGNSTPPAGKLASSFPADPRQNGFADMVIFWDTVDMLNADGGSNSYAHPGHLGCNSRLDGPADKQYSACMSCHGTASVADSNIKVPPIAAQFGGLTSECALRDPTDPSKWIDASGAVATEKAIDDGPVITFAELDSIYFASTGASTPYNTTVPTANGPVNILPGQPNYADTGRTDWISLDYSLQLSISIVQWKQWQLHEAEEKAPHLRVHSAILPRR